MTTAKGIPHFVAITGSCFRAMPNPRPSLGSPPVESE